MVRPSASITHGCNGWSDGKGPSPSFPSLSPEISGGTKWSEAMERSPEGRARVGSGVSEGVQGRLSL